MKSRCLFFFTGYLLACLILPNPACARETNFEGPSKTQQERVRQRLSLMHELLHDRSREELNDSQRKNRNNALDHLKEYISNGVFPVFRDKASYWKPIFKDPYGTWCAVGYLLVATGHHDLANDISGSDNFVHIDEIENFSNTKLGEWAQDFGFTQTELALIQPYSYGADFEYTSSYEAGFEPERWSCPSSCSECFPRGPSPDDSLDSGLDSRFDSASPDPDTTEPEPKKPEREDEPSEPEPEPKKPEQEDEPPEPEPKKPEREDEPSEVQEKKEKVEQKEPEKEESKP